VGRAAPVGGALEGGLSLGHALGGVLVPAAPDTWSDHGLGRLRLLAGLQAVVGALPVRDAQLVDRDGLQVLLQTPQPIGLPERDARAGARGELADVDAELPPRQLRPAVRVSREQVAETDAVVLAQVGLDGLAMLPQELDEAADSPAPQCLR
jgi:hypothetical protein